MKNPGFIFEVIEGQYKGKFFVVRKNEQTLAMVQGNKVIGHLFEDSEQRKPCTPVATYIFKMEKLKQIGFID